MRGVTPAERRETASRALGLKRDEFDRLRTVGPSCRDCIYGPDHTAKGVCRHMIHATVRHETVSDTLDARSFVFTTTARSEDGLCGPEALLYEARPRLLLLRLLRAARLV